MYTHISKGYTIGQTLTRRLLRTLTGIPGLLIDLVVAFLWTKGFSDYWQNARLPFNDDETTTYFRCLTGWVGEVLGYFLGAFVGALTGMVLFIPDFFISRLCAAYTAMTIALDDFSQMIGKHSRMSSLKPVENPKYYLQKSWNISVGTLGFLLGGVLYEIAKGVEVFLPIGDLMSRFMWRLGGFVGGMVGAILSIPIYPIKNVSNKFVTFYADFKDKVRSIVAFIYVKTNQEPAQQNQDCPCVNTAIHSEEFRAKVVDIKQRTTSALLYGELKGNPPMNPDAEFKDNDPLICPITQTRFIKPVVDRAGHTFEESAIKDWLNRGNKTCPVGTEQLAENDLAVNRALVGVLEKR